MKQLFLAQLFVALLFWAPLRLAGETCPKPSATGHKDAVPLCAVVNQVKSALLRYQSSIGANQNALPPLSKAEFDLKTAAATTAGGKISLFVFTIGGSREKAVTNEVTFTYAPRKTSAGALTPRTPASLEDQLFETIRGAAEQIQMAQTVGDLPFSSLTVNVQFCVKWDGNAGVDAPVSLITVGLSGDKSRDITQSVTLTFARP